MEHHGTLCGLFTADRQARPDRSLLRAREQHGKISQSASERCGTRTRSLLLAQRKEKENLYSSLNCIRKRKCWAHPSEASILHFCKGYRWQLRVSTWKWRDGS